MKQKLLEILLSEISVSGEETALQDKLERHMKETVEEVKCERDRIGDGMYTVEGKSGKKILLSAHIDEIGLMVTGADADGFLKVTNVGGIKALAYPGHSVKIQTENGMVYGSVAADGKAMKSDGFGVKDLLVDIGVSTKEEALCLVSPGDVVVPDTSIRELQNDRISARGLDDRSGVYVIMEALKQAREKKTPHTVCAAATVGEETSKHGARWVAERTSPDEAIIVDVTYTSDYPGMQTAEWGEVKLGGGPAICINPIFDKKITRSLMDIAKEQGIPYQPEVSAGKSCTDADEIHFAGSGIPTALVSIPLRYMHSPSEVADAKDLEWCIELLAEYLSR